MQRLHMAITAGLAVAVVILAVLLIQREWLASETPAQKQQGNVPSATDTTPLRPQIVRLTEPEAVLKKLGYEAWVYRFHGGMIDGEVYSEAGPGKPRSLGGENMWSQLQLLDKATINRKTNPVTLSSVSGMLVVLLGPFNNKPDRRPRLVPCRVLLEAKAPSGNGMTADFTIEEVTFYHSAWDDELSVNVYGKEKLGNPGPTLPALGASTVGLLGSPDGHAPLLAASALFPGRTLGIVGVTADLESRYKLLQLRWLVDADKR